MEAIFAEYLAPQKRSVNCERKRTTKKRRDGLLSKQSGLCHKRPAPRTKSGLPFFFELILTLATAKLELEHENF